MLPPGLLNAIVASTLTPPKVRRLLLKAHGLDIRTSGIQARCFFGGSDIRLGRLTSVNVGCVFDNNAAIDIGESCWIGMEVMFITSTHEEGPPSRRAGAVIPGAIRVGDGTWIGSRATVLPGVTIGPGCIIGAGSLVREDCAPNGVYAGVPARRLRDLPAG